LQNQHVDAFCVGAPWNSVAVDLGIGHILHFDSEIFARAAEKYLGVRQRWADENPDVLTRLVRAHRRAAHFVDDERNRDEVAALLAAPHRVGVAAEVIRRTLNGRLKVSPEGAFRTDPRYLLVGREGAARPDAAQAAWLYAQMVRWGQAPLSREMLAAAKAVCRPDLYDAALDEPDTPSSKPADGIGAFAGPAFDPDDIEAHLAAWDIKRRL
jgi:ABC-type nitrate/sulfonate/bicarbonate transport system substrate-binding protein